MISISKEKYEKILIGKTFLFFLNLFIIHKKCVLKMFIIVIISVISTKTANCEKSFAKLSVIYFFLTLL